MLLGVLLASLRGMGASATSLREVLSAQAWQDTAPRRGSAGNTGAKEGRDPLGIYTARVEMSQQRSSHASHRTPALCLTAGSPAYREVKQSTSLVQEGLLKRSLKEEHMVYISL